jgi:hypothetical protein
MTRMKRESDENEVNNSTIYKNYNNTYMIGATKTIILRKIM